MLINYKNNLKQHAKLWLAVKIGGIILKIILRTCKIEILTPKINQRLFSGLWRTIGITWHCYAIFFIYYYSSLNPAIMVSNSKDGKILNNYIKSLGGTPIRGSSNNKGIEALNKMKLNLKNSQVMHAATVADGPQGPRYIAKIGMILLAMHTRLPLLPIIWSANRTWILRKSWDHMVLPKPFSHIKILYGSEYYYPQYLNKKDLEIARADLEKELNELRN